MKNNNISIPILMYHSVGMKNSNWNWNYLTCPYTDFENQLKCLFNNGYNTITLSELKNHLEGITKCKPKSCVITFDDGYLDNWVFAFPLLKKYNMCGTVFINPDFVDPRPLIRKTLADVDDVTKLETVGFLSWDELSLMESSGIMTIESHAMTHTWYPSSSKIVDFRHPNDPYVWMTWNNYPQNKPFLQVDNETLIQYGEPVYEFNKSLSSKRYIPDPKLKSFLINSVIKFGGRNFFDNSNWRSILYKELDTYKSQYKIDDKYESDYEYQLRLKDELSNSKSILEQKLNKRIFFLCWPGGSATKNGMKIATELGYSLFNVARDLTKQERGKFKNTWNSKVNRVSRFAPVLFFNNHENNQGYILYSKGVYFLFQVYSHSSNQLLRLAYKFVNTAIKLVFSIIK